MNDAHAKGIAALEAMMPGAARLTTGGCYETNFGRLADYGFRALVRKPSKAKIKKRQARKRERKARRARRKAL